MNYIRPTIIGLLALAGAVVLLAQLLPTTTLAAVGSLSGTVTDSDEAAIAGVVIEVIDPPELVVASVTTDSNGDYTIPSVLEATYTVEATPPVESGFAVATIPDVTISGSTILDIVLVPLPPPPVGGIAEVLIGGGEAPASTGAGSGSSSLLYAALAGAVAAGAIAITAGGWYARRRWLR